MLGRWIDVEPFGRLHPKLADAALGVVASVPLLLGLWWSLRTELPSVRHLVQLVQAQLGPVLASRSPAVLAVLSILAGTAEEVLFRGVVQQGLGHLLPDGVALAVTSILFGLAHFLTPAYALLAAAAGLYLGTLFLLQGNLLVPIVTHALYDFVALTYLVRRYRAARKSE